MDNPDNREEKEPTDSPEHRANQVQTELLDNRGSRVQLREVLDNLEHLLLMYRLQVLQQDYQVALV